MRFQISTVVLLVSFGISALAAPLGTSTNTVDITSSNGVSTPAPDTACECPTNLNRPRHILPRALPADVNPGDWVNVLNTIGENLPKVGFTTEERANSYRKFWQVFNASVKINKDAILEYALDREGLARHLLAHSPEEQRPELLKHLIGYRLLEHLPENDLMALQKAINYGKGMLDNWDISIPASEDAEEYVGRKASSSKCCVIA